MIRINSIKDLKNALQVGTKVKIVKCNFDGDTTKLDIGDGMVTARSRQTAKIGGHYLVFAIDDGFIFDGTNRFTKLFFEYRREKENQPSVVIKDNPNYIVYEIQE